MNRSSALCRLLLALALLGVVIAPFGQAFAKPVMAAQSMAAMPDDMDCCPGEPAVTMDCSTDCPFVALCIAGFAGIVLPPSNTIEFVSLSGVAFSPGESFALSSLAGDPPSRPPKV